MLFDWFTIIAQIVNFLILVLLLKRFLYGPIIRAMDAREARIAKDLAGAEKAREEAREREARAREEERRAVERRAELMADARREVQDWRERTLAEARREVEHLKQAWLEHLGEQREAFLDRLKTRIAEQVLAVGDKVLRDLAHAGLQEEVLEVFLRRLEAEKEALPLVEDGKPVKVRSGFDLTGEMAERLRRRVAPLLPPGTEVETATDKEMGIGIEWASGDRKISWTLERYLEGLEHRILAELPRERS